MVLASLEGFKAENTTIGYAGDPGADRLLGLPPRAVANEGG